MLFNMLQGAPLESVPLNLTLMLFVKIPIFGACTALLNPSSCDPIWMIKSGCCFRKTASVYNGSTYVTVYWYIRRAYGCSYIAKGTFLSRKDVMSTKRNIILTIYFIVVISIPLSFNLLQ